MSANNIELIMASAGHLEVEVVPAASTAQPSPASSPSRVQKPVALVCHPHPLHGGSKDNKVVHTLCRAWRDSGIDSVRFNFRGVGNSAGHFDDGRGELQDLRDVVSFIHERFPFCDGVILAGFSFGAFIVASYAAAELINVNVLTLPEKKSLPIVQLILVAPPVQYENFPRNIKFPVPVTVIQGDADEIVPFPLVRGWVEGEQQVEDNQMTFDVLQGAGHFFHGRLADVKKFVQSSLQLLPGK